MAKVKAAAKPAPSAEEKVRFASPANWHLWVKRYPTGASAVSGLLVALSFAGPSQFWLAWIGMAGLTGAMLGAPSLKAAAKAGFAYGAVLSAVHHHWMLFVRMPAPIGWALSAGIIGGFFAVWALLSKGPGRSHPAVLIWGYLLLEHAVNLGPFSFGWYTLGYSQWNSPATLWLATIIGAHGLSLLILLSNLALWRFMESRKRRGLIAIGVGLAACALVAYSPVNPATFGSSTNTSGEEMFNLVTVQINVSNEEKELPSQTASVVQNHLTKAGEALEKTQEGVPTLVVFPETFVAAYLEDDPSLTPLWEALKAFAMDHKVWLAFGLNDMDPLPSGQVDRNAFVLMNPKGEVVNRYFKRNLVPFGEYVPYRFLIDKVPPLGKWVSENVFPYDNTPGEKMVLFKGPLSQKFFAPICFETSFPWMFRQAANGGADWVLTPTNDAWFGKSLLAVQHMAQGVMRAVESGLPVIQVSNSGVSYAASSDGQLPWRTSVMTSDISVKLLTISRLGSAQTDALGQNGLKSLTLVKNETIYNGIGGFLEGFVLYGYPFCLLWFRRRPATIAV